MSSDIQPLTSIIPTPLVREKRHYPNDQQQPDDQKKQENKQPKQTTIDEIEHDADAEIYESESALENNMDTDEKNTGVKHIDEYA